ncbi:MAG: sporulation protein [Clostridiales bacterium]|jgi:uncharacterized spore protein YtfJ|nr:sporulation protein [Clostridiales bacterium]
MSSESVNHNLQTLFSKMEEFISTKTVIGEPIHFDDVILVPLVDVSFGVGAGVNESAAEKKGDAGGGGMGAKLSPSAVVVIVNGTVQLVNVKNQDSVNKLIDMIPGLLSKINWSSLFGKEDKKKNDENFAGGTFNEKRVAEEL